MGAHNPASCGGWGNLGMLQADLTPAVSLEAGVSQVKGAVGDSRKSSLMMSRMRKKS